MDANQTKRLQGMTNAINAITGAVQDLEPIDVVRVLAAVRELVELK